MVLDLNPWKITLPVLERDREGIAGGSGNARLKPRRRRGTPR